MPGAVHVKAELGSINFGLRKDSVEIFTCRIVSFCAIGR
jgi:hypothetical protein